MTPTANVITASGVIQSDTPAPAAFISTKRAMTILLAVNALPLLLLPIALWRSIGLGDRGILPSLVVGLVATAQAQLFLLAFWMAFGGWPQRRRTLSIFAITIACGLCLGLSYSVVMMISIPAATRPGSWISHYVLIVMAPIVASGLLWMFSAIYIIPAWCFGYEINLRSSAQFTRSPKRTFALPQLIAWTAQVALPLGSLNLFLAVTDNRVAALRIIAPFVAVLISGTPLAVALLAPKLPLGLIGVACIWCGVVAALVSYIPITSNAAFPWQTDFVYAITIAANLIALRQLGFCWQPRTA